MTNFFKFALAGPEMLGALKEARAALEFDINGSWEKADALERVEAAIARIEGEREDPWKHQR